MWIRAIEAVSTVSGWLSGLGVIVMTVLVVVDVFLRYVFRSPLLFSDDVSVYCMIYITFVGAALTMKMGRHIRVDLLYLHLSKRAQLRLDVATSLIGMIVLFIVTWQSVGWVQYTYRFGFKSSGILETPMWIPMSVIPLGLFFFSLQYIAEVGKAIGLLRNYRPDEEGRSRG